ncbi:hypothetical protein NK718_03510 [Alsobacter sp. SYSU M60028]|uniref:Uncharacterized protein n=1 Tax=Alsobacter ponti TaxID=2962936 RepID=A0ABT1L7W0_9HYPH|nr:hypothetical protein [Alsobacter ponti]MCP8937570.1 hypothetical protein [Alsobacter ponti]
MWRILAMVALLACPQAQAQTKPARALGTQFWNLTGVTLKEVRLAPAGTKRWGPNQCANDKDGEVDFDERLPISGAASGAYDVLLRDVKGRACYARNVAVREGEIFAIHEKDLGRCAWR